MKHCHIMKVSGILPLWHISLICHFHQNIQFARCRCGPIGQVSLYTLSFLLYTLKCCQCPVININVIRRCFGASCRMICSVIDQSRLIVNHREGDRETVRKSRHSFATSSLNEFYSLSFPLYLSCSFETSDFPTEFPISNIVYDGKLFNETDWLFLN